jgi:hypothetical protein
MEHILNPTTTHFTGRKEFIKVSGPELFNRLTNPHAQATCFVVATIIAPVLMRCHIMHCWAAKLGEKKSMAPGATEF